MGDPWSGHRIVSIEQFKKAAIFNTFKPNGIFQSHQLDKFSSKLRVVGWVFFIFN